MINKFRLWIILLFNMMGITVQGYRIATMKLELSSAKQVAPLSAISPAHYGVNIGHSCSADDSWQVSMRRLGITKARMFGVGGISAHSLGVPSKGLGTAVTGLTNSYGSSLSGSMVSVKIIIVINCQYEYGGILPM